MNPLSWFLKQQTFNLQYKFQLKKMQKLVFSLLLAMFFIACQDTPPGAADAPPPAEPMAAPVPLPASPEMLKQASKGLNDNMAALKSLQAEVDALPAAVKKAKVAEIEVMNVTIEGIVEKQTQMVKDVQSVLNPGQTDAGASQETGAASSLNEAEAKDIQSSVERYAQDIQNMKAEMIKITGKQ